MKKHAYLIIAHHHFDMLERMVKALDSEQADFYIHINKKAKGFDETRLFRAAEKSHIQIFRKYKITWGADTQIRCEMFLLKQAVAGGYDYYHLLSGVDIPLKTGAEIEGFFETQTKSFLEIKEEKDLRATLDRVRYYHLLQKLIGRQKADRGFAYALLDQLAYESVKIQKLLRVDRTKRAPFSYCRGGNWFSITHDLAAYAVKKKALVRRYFYWSITADEMFLQCIACASEYKDSIIPENLRLVDWQRTEHGGCSPHTFTMEDYEMLVNSDKLFARKFDPAIDGEIIDVLYGRLEAAKAENDN